MLVRRSGFRVGRPVPPGLKATDPVAIPGANGEPATSVNAPARLTPNTATSSLPVFGATSSLPLGLNATLCRLNPLVLNGEPLTPVNVPRAPTENIVTEPGPSLTDASNRPLGLNATANGNEPPGNGEPVT